MVALHRSAMSNRTWVIDSGASHNYGNNLRDFRNDSVMETNMIIKLGDKHQVQAKKKGVVRLGDVEIEVFFVPEFRISLLSVGQLDSYGYTSNQASARSQMPKDGRFLVLSSKKASTYYRQMDRHMCRKSDCYGLAPKMQRH